jgi:DNA-binding SARP family transcriptional activator
LARLYLSGGLRLDGPSGSFTDGDLPGNQGRIAFAALAVERRPLSHDELADIVWDEMPPSQWKSALTAVISKTRSLISTTGLDGRAVLTSVGGAYALSPPAEIWVDLEEAMRRLDRAEGALRHGNHADATRDATVASSILRRPFLTGIDNLWVDRVRRRLADALYRSSISLASGWNHLGDHQLAATAAETAIQLDPLRELAHRLLIEAEQARGDRSAARRAYSRCVDILATELGVPPSPETLDLARILHHQPGAGARAAGRAEVGRSATES